MKKVLISGTMFPSSIDCSTAYHGFEQLGDSITFLDNWIMLLKSDLKKFDLCVGSVNQIHWALFTLGFKNYHISCYPQELNSFLHRNIYESTIENIIKSFPVNKFIKPVRPKRFSSFTTDTKPFHNEKLQQNYLLQLLFNLDETEKVYISDLIKFKSEWRVYVKSGIIKNICFYEGNCLLFPDTDTIKKMISSFTDAPCCYALDVGVVDSIKKHSSRFNETALVEVNDFYSIGNYGLPATTYANMLYERWIELTK